MTFTYDGSDRITSIVDSAGRTVSYAYDVDGNLQTATRLGSAAWTYTYDAGHNLTSITNPNGRVTTITNASVPRRMMLCARPTTAQHTTWPGSARRRHDRLDLRRALRLAPVRTALRAEHRPVTTKRKHQLSLVQLGARIKRGAD